MKLQNVLNQLTKDVTNYGKKGTAARTANYLSGRLTLLEKTMEQAIISYDSEVSGLEGEEEEKLEAAYEKIREMYCDYRSDILDAIDKIKAKESKDEASTGTINTTHSSNQTKNADIKLKNITVPVFSGCYETWRNFHDMFKSLVHTNSSLSEIQKMHYLKTSVTGEAEKLLSHLTINNGNYLKAWTILNDRYDHKRFLVNTHLKCLFNQATIMQEQPESIKMLLDTSMEVVHSLENLSVPVKSWDAVLIYVLLNKLPSKTQQQWEEKLSSKESSKELPSFSEFTQFLETRFRMLEAVNIEQDTTSSTSAKRPTQRNSFHTQATNSKSCKVCNKSFHPLRKCGRFLKMSISERIQTVGKLGLCNNCFAYSHLAAQCPSSSRCYYCQQPHHSLLHFTQAQTYQHQHYTNQPPSSNPYLQPQIRHSSNPFIQAQPTQPPRQTYLTSTINPEAQSFQPPNGEQPPRHTYVTSTINPEAQPFQPSNGEKGTSNLNVLHAVPQAKTQVLLATAIIKVRSSSGEMLPLRALLDSGSEATFITESAVQLLRLKPSRTHVEVSGLGLVSSGTCTGFVDIVVASRHTTFETTTQAFIYKSLSGHLPARTLPTTHLKHLTELVLADPTFFKPSKVDILLGSDILAEILMPELIQPQDKTLPLAQNTRLGWILFGKAPIDIRPIHSFFQTVTIENQLKKFWELEETPFKKYETAEDVECEDHYLRNVTRTADGHYQVALPFKGNIFPILGRSREGAYQRFKGLERRFVANPQLQRDYARCLEEYIDLKHMVEVEAESIGNAAHYFLPHHAVLKEHSSTTKLRVVFDASYRTADGTSLNDHLMTGPALQQNVIDVTLRWRLYRFTFSADIEKMYRQIWVTDADSNYQLVFWRRNLQDKLKVFRLKTVTFGTAAAPYLAIRTLLEVSKQSEFQFPRAAKMIRDEMYVDDLLSGADTIEEAADKIKEINGVLKTAGFNLRKWTSNNVALLSDIPIQERESTSSVPLDGSNQVKMLGMCWLPVSDVFCFRFIPPSNPMPTKRFILSTIARLYDPMGWISPCILQAKRFMQQLWIRKMSWDETIEPQILKEWTLFFNDLPAINNIRLSRWVQTIGSSGKIELHGFSDASERAYGAAVYLRAEDEQGRPHMHLIISKAKVAPLEPVTLPRLELCGAVVLAKLLNYTAQVIQRQDVQMYAWTDSSITLSWILAPASKWETFIRNRVGEIQRLTPANIWRHVPTEHNPADLASRGVLPSMLVKSSIWWHGPSFLRSDWRFELPEQPSHSSIMVDHPTKVQTLHAELGENRIILLIYRSSNFQRLLKTLSYCIRFVTNSRKCVSTRNSGPICPKEIQKARTVLSRCAQQEMFPEGICRSRGMGSLNPFQDADAIFRVGGRLQHANITYDQQHPVILEPRHHLTNLIIRDAHERTLHGGIQLMMCYLRTKYWICQMKRTVKKYLHSCTICHRFRCKAAQQLMGELPTPRVTVSKPFTHVGIDYAGPITIRAWKGRGAKSHKGYFCIFVCLSTKAIHLEAVSDLTTQAFLAAFQRFAARRGVSSQIYSDCGTNFVGADAELRRLLKKGMHDWKEIAEVLSIQGTRWNFIPPASPHFGGLWEAGVKSVKYHLKRTIGNGTFTYEELATLLSQIEACLNSRPLCPLSENSDDFQALTPAHFLVGGPLFTVPEPDLTIDKVSYNDRWKTIQTHLQSFWKQWRVEYLTRLQQRPKWLKPHPDIKIGDLVLVKDERLPPARWSLGRIMDTYPGPDHLTRVAKVKTQFGEFKRPITKLCPLPVADVDADKNP